jgi:hypothetical protein
MESIATLALETLTEPSVVVPTVVVSAALFSGLVARVGQAWQERGSQRAR